MTGRIMVTAADEGVARILSASGCQVVAPGEAADVLVTDAGLTHDESLPTVVVCSSQSEAEAALARGAFDIVAPDDPVGLVARVRAAWRYATALTALGEAVRTDVLTGLANRKHVDEHLRMTASAARRHHQPLSLLMIDVDHLRRVNDKLGHAAGDAVIKAVADRIVHLLRTEDLAGRWGGEEFLVLLPSTDLDGSWVLGERIREACSDPIALGGSDDVVVTVSIGCAEGAGDDIDDHLKRAEAALEEAKAAGRNRVVLDTTVVA